MNIYILPPADVELDDAINYYNEQLPGLGDSFYQEFLKTTEIISYFPESWRKVGSKTRRANIKKFPYLILYIVDGQDVLITCIAHQHRDPRYYVERIA